MTIVLNGTTGITSPEVDVLGDLTAYSFNGGQAAGFRNKIINGKMEIAQRGTSFAAATDGQYTLDRWMNSITGGGVVTVSQQSDAPSNNEFQNSLRATVTPTADTTIAATDYAGFIHVIEGYNVRDLIGKTFTLSFWVRSSKTGVHCIAFRNVGTTNSDRSYITEYTVNVANTWEYKTITVTGGLITAGTWNWTNGVGLKVWFGMAAGSTYQTTANSWQTGNFVATSNQVNCLDAVNNIFAIAGVQLEVGSVATPFEHRPVGTELQLCQRYYEKSYDYGVVPGTGSTSSPYTTSVQASSQYVRLSGTFSAAKRATPTMVLYSPSTGGTGLLNADSTTVAGIILGTQTGFNFYVNNVTTTINQFISGHWTASAEL